MEQTRKRCVLLRFWKREPVLCIAAVCAAASVALNPPSADYLNYIDWRVLSLLFCLMAVVAGLQECGVFAVLAQRLLAGERRMRFVTLCLVLLPFFVSMLVTNDVALITFVPFAVLVLGLIGRTERLIYIVVLQTIAANLGSMATPVGNPQNLYLYSFFEINAGEFFAIMAIPFAVAFVLIAGTCFVVKPEPIRLETHPEPAPPVWRMIVYFVLFALSVMIVFRVFPYYVGLIVVTVALAILEPKCFLRVDYGLLLTFCAFFVFSGNLARIPAVRDLLASVVAMSPLLVGTATCQVISNVPSAVLLSRFTTDYRHLLIAVNIGGLGTPVSSLASLITLGEYRKREPGKTLRYLGLFSLINFSYLAVLIGSSYLADLIV